MKYLFLDCFASFSPCILAGGLLDMLKNEKSLKTLCERLGFTEIFIGEEKRCGMEANFVRLEYETKKATLNTDELFKICEKLSGENHIKEKLIKYVNIMAEAKSIEPKSAVFDAKKATDALIFTAYALDSISGLKAEKIWVSKVFLPSADMCSQTQAQKISNSMYILKKHNISYTTTPINTPFLSEEDASLLAILDASCKEGVRGNIIKIGYGAGEDDIKEMPNILRVVYGDDNNEDLLFTGAAEINDLFSDIQTAEA